LVKIFFKIGPFVGLKKIDCDKIESVVESFDLDSPDKSLTVNDIKIESKYNDQNRIIKWKYISTVLDKIFFYILIIYFFISFIAAVLSLPNFYKFT